MDIGIVSRNHRIIYPPAIYLTQIVIVHNQSNVTYISPSSSSAHRHHHHYYYSAVMRDTRCAIHVAIALHLNCNYINISCASSYVCMLLLYSYVRRVRCSLIALAIFALLFIYIYLYNISHFCWLPALVHYLHTCYILVLCMVLSLCTNIM